MYGHRQQQYDSGELAPGKKECYDGAVTCGEVGRAIRKLTTRGNQDLRRTSTWMDRIKNRLRTLMLVELLGGASGRAVLVYTGGAVLVGAADG